jgi:hypothetical protein
MENQIKYNYASHSDSSNEGNMLNIPFFALHVLLDTKQASTPTATADAK